jgi:hypothetical protein
LDEIVVINGDGDALAMVVIFNPEHAAHAANADRLS